MRRCCPLFLVCVVYLTGVVLHAQSSSTAAPQPDAPESTQLWASNLGDEPVGIGDLIFLSVTGSPELSRSYRISADGRLTLPLVHDAIPVVGMIPTAIAQAVSDSLIRSRVLVAPIVSCVVLEYRSRRVSVVGAVRSPVIIQAIGDLTLLDAITRAQGFDPEAGPEVIVSRPIGATGALDTIRIPIKDLLAGDKPALNIPLHGGEEIRVPVAPRLFIMGNVKMPGSYPLSDLDGSSVLKALALSQGILPFTAKRAYIYRLSQASTKRQEIAIPLQDILHRKSSDVQLQANDILYVPENAKAHLSADVLDRIAGFGSTVGSGLVIWH